MTPTRDDERLSAEDERFVRRVAEGMRPPARSDAQQRAFQRKLEARLHAPRRALFGLPAVAAAAAMAVAAFVLLRAETAPVTESVGSVMVETVSTGSVESLGAGALPEELLAGFASAGSASEALPEDYAAIGDVLLGS